MDDESRASGTLAVERPGRRGAAIAALATVPVLVALVLFVLITNFGLVVVLVAAFALFFVGGWIALSRRGWQRAGGVVAGALGALGVLAVVIGIGWVSTTATLGIFVSSGAFVALTRYALGDRLEVDG